MNTVSLQPNKALEVWKYLLVGAEQIRDDETDSAKESKLERNQEKYQKVVRELVEPLNSDEDFPLANKVVCEGRS